MEREDRDREVGKLVIQSKAEDEQMRTLLDHVRALSRDLSTLSTMLINRQSEVLILDTDDGLSFEGTTLSYDALKGLAEVLKRLDCLKIKHGETTNALRNYGISV